MHTATKNTRVPHQGRARWRYSPLGGTLSRSQSVAVLTGLCMGTGLAALYVLYLTGADVAPDSGYGLGFAVAGTTLLLLVGGGFVVRKRLRHHWVGRLHTALAWHMIGGLLGLLLIMMHAAGNFNPRSGTYALYGLIAVAVSGIVGRLLDRVCPRLAARAALATLSADGREHLEHLEMQLGSLPRYPRPPLDSSMPQHPASHDARPAVPHASPWDLAYHRLDPPTSAIPIMLTQSADHGTVGASRGARPSPRSVHLQVRHQARALQTTLGTEQFYIALIRTWRRLHAALSLIALGLLAWHLIYALTLVWATR